MVIRIGKYILDQSICNFDWDSLRKETQVQAGKREKTDNTMDSVDWDAVRRAENNQRKGPNVLFFDSLDQLQQTNTCNFKTKQNKKRTIT